MRNSLLLILVTIFIITGGWLILKENQKKELISTNESKIEKYLKYNYENIETITLETVIINPTGVPHIIGYVNENPDMMFDAGIYNDFFEGSLSSIGKIPLIRTDKAVNEGFKNVYDIEKEEAEQEKKGNN